MIHLPTKHTGAEITIFSRMSALAQHHKAINLSQGFPDFPIDDAFTSFIADGVASGYNQYAPLQGLPMLRDAIATDFNGRYLVNIDPDTEVTIIPGATYGIFTALAATLSSGDEAILFEPAYDSYLPGIELNGGIPVPLPLSLPDYRVDWDMVKNAITPRTKAIIVNTPHNPTGACFKLDDWNHLADIIRDTNIVVISDEVYEQLVFDGKPHYSITLHPELRERSYAVFSFGKVYNNTGWKVGYVLASPVLSHAFRKIHQYLVFTVNSPAQYALAKYLNTPAKPIPSALMQKKRDFFLEGLKQTPFTIYEPSNGSFFQIAGYRQISTMSDVLFAEWLTIEHGVATIPVSAFYHNRQDHKLIRFCFAKTENTLEIALERLAMISI
jgi:methionine aminotransferase